ncbi:hypothetical protein JQC91_02775 [Jannaschia sp. Os4]|uniref:DUF6958 family protein n=1 Tax=Jannaschia sp. Os4 TaxID=2807617 RepID=UPI00193A3FBB|nr:hypothetical protein [Jannaschia sp. Os4]MBM2575219.1 hypothetical protein [Jannaschia sp. Os4]
MTERIPCRTPANPEGGTSNIPAWKYDAFARAIRAALADGPMRQAEVKDAAAAHLTDEERAAMGSLGWHATTVRLEMEVRGDLRRLPGAPVRVALP